MRRALFLGAALCLLLAAPGARRAAAMEGPGDKDLQNWLNPPPPPKPAEPAPAAKAPAGGAAVTAPTQGGGEGEKAPAPVKLASPVEVLPEKCALFVTVPRASRLFDGLSKTALAELAAEREMADLIDKLMKPPAGPPTSEKVEPGLLDIVKRTGFDADKLKAVFSKQVALAAFTSQKDYRVCLVAAVDDEKDAASTFVARLVAELKRAYPTTNDSGSAWKRDIEIHSVRTQWGEFSYAMMGNLLAVGYGEGALDDVAERFLDGGKSWADNADYKSIYADLGKGADLYFQADGAEALKLIATKAGAPTEALSGAGIIAGASRVDKGGVRDRIWILPDKNAAAKFLPYAPRKNLELEKYAKYIPVGAIFLQAQAIDLSVLDEAMTKGLAEAPKEAREMMSSLFADLDIKSIPQAFGDEMAVGVLKSPGMLYPEGILVLGVKNPAKAAEIATRIEKTALDKIGGLKFETTDYSEHKIHYLNAEGLATKAAAFAPAYAFTATGDMVLVGTTLGTLKKAIRQGSRLGRMKNILEKPDFVRVTEDFPQARTELGYLDIRQLVEGVMPLVGMVAGASKAMGGITAADLPPVDVLDKHLFGLGWCWTVSDDKAVFESYGPAGLVSMAALGAAWAVPQVMAQRAEQDRESAKARLARIGVGLHLFAADNDRFPLSLSELHPMYVASLGTFEGPRGPKVETVEDIDAKGAYVYLPGRSLNDLGDSVLVYEKNSVSPAGRHVLRLDMGIAFYKTKDFEQYFKGLLEAERQKMASQR